MTSYSEGPLIPQKVTRSPREPGSQECETLRYSTRTSPAGALRPSTAGCRSFRQGYLQADPLFADRARLESRPGSHPPELLLHGEDCVMRLPPIAVRHLFCLQNLHRSLTLVGWNMTTQEHVAQGLEVERKFLVPDKPGFLKDCDRKRIRQGYLAVGKNGTEVRVRQEGKQYFLTIKSGQGKARVEEELKIGRKRFDSLWPLTRGRRVRKVRYFASHHDKTIEVDV